MSLTVGELVGYMKIDDRDFNDKIDKGGSRWSKFSTGMKTAMVGAAATAGAAMAGFAAVVHTGFGEIMDAEKVTAQLAASIKSTGGAAGVTVDHLNDLASSIQDYSGQTDDSIASAESLLLTFTKIKNVGADKIFDEATEACANMAAKMGGDASTYAIQLGKALNDPIAGMTALRRVGVSFTEAQEDQIKAMVEAGDVMGAQKLILAELSVEFGGAAAAAGGALPGVLERLKRLWEDFSQTVMAGAIPALKNFGQAILDHQPQIMALAEVIGEKLGKVFEWLSNEVIPHVTEMFDGFTTDSETNRGLLETIFTAIGTYLGTMRTVFETIWPAVKTIVETFVKWLNGEEGQKLIDSLLTLICSALTTLQGVFVAVWPAVQTLVETFIKFLNSDTGQKLISSLLGLVVTAVQAVADIFNAVWPALEPIVDTFCKFLASPAIQKILVTLFETVAKLVTAILTVFQKVWPALSPLVDAACKLIGPILTAMMVPINALIWAIERLKDLWDWFTRTDPRIDDVERHVIGVREAGYKIGGGSFAEGGTIPGRGPIPIIAHGGETVATVGQTSAIERLIPVLQGLAGRGGASFIFNLYGGATEADGNAAARGFLRTCSDNGLVF